MNIIRSFFSYTILAVFIFSTASCGSSQSKIDARWAMDRNECTKLQGKVLVYTIFVDSKESKLWTGFDIRSALDSVNRATEWIAEQAENIDLEFTVDYHNSDQASRTLNKKLPDKSMYALFKGKSDKGGPIDKTNKWADALAKKAADQIALPTEKDKKQKLQGIDRLTQMLRKKYGVKNVVVLFMLNNYYIADMSVTLNTMTDQYKEYAVNSYRNSAVIAQQILSLFGAAILYKQPGEDRGGMERDHKLAQREFPDDIMVNYNRDLTELEINALTRYLLGWDDEIDVKFETLFFSNKKKPQKKEEKGKGKDKKSGTKKDTEE